jgi:CubicO group peptidase (beta-lactamase class C family)
MSRYWPQFAEGGKRAVTVRIALSHQAGLGGVEPQLSLEETVDTTTSPRGWPPRCRTGIPARRTATTH